MVRKVLYCGFNKLELDVDKDICFTDDFRTAESFAYYFYTVKRGRPVVFVVEGDFEKVGFVSNCFKLLSNDFRVLKRIKLKRC
jgi:hypothetical protein